MTGYSYYVVATEDKNGKHYAYVAKVANSSNLLCQFPSYAIHVNACKTAKEARHIADFWNECYKKNGTYVFSN